MSDTREPTVSEEFYAHNRKAEAFGTVGEIAESLPKRFGYHGFVVLNEYEVMKIVNTCKSAEAKLEKAP